MSVFEPKMPGVPSSSRKLEDGTPEDTGRADPAGATNQVGGSSSSTSGPDRAAEMKFERPVPDHISTSQPRKVFSREGVPELTQLKEKEISSLQSSAKKPNIDAKTREALNMLASSFSKDMTLSEMFAGLQNDDGGSNADLNRGVVDSRPGSRAGVVSAGSHKRPCSQNRPSSENCSQNGPGSQNQASLAARQEVYVSNPISRAGGSRQGSRGGSRLGSRASLRDRSAEMLTTTTEETGAVPHNRFVDAVPIEGNSGLGETEPPAGSQPSMASQSPNMEAIPNLMGSAISLSNSQSSNPQNFELAAQNALQQSTKRKVESGEVTETEAENNDELHGGSSILNAEDSLPNAGSRLMGGSGMMVGSSMTQDRSTDLAGDSSIYSSKFIPDAEIAAGGGRDSPKIRREREGHHKSADKKKNGKSVSIGDSPRTPSPGTVNRNNMNSPGSTFGGSSWYSGPNERRKQPVHDANNPPAMGVLSQYNTGPRWSMAVKSKFGDCLAVNNRNPAPGTYELAGQQGKYKTAPKFSFGGGNRFRQYHKEGPAPGNYDPVDPVLETGVSVGFGTSQRGLGSNQKAPGPGTYEFRSTVGVGPRFTARGRTGGTKVGVSGSRSVPGPGAYSIPSQMEVGPKPGFGTSTRDAESRRLLGNRADQPGPGAYNVVTTVSQFKHPKISFTHRAVNKGPLIEQYLSPGPGSYDAHTSSFRRGRDGDNMRRSRSTGHV